MEKQFTYSLLGLALLTTSFTATADETAKQAFEAAYAGYQSAVKTQDKDAEQAFAEESYQHGCRLHGPDSLNCASLAVNLANAFSESSEQTERLFKHALPIYMREFGSNSIEVADLYIQQGDFLNLSKEQAKEPLGEAIDIAEALEADSPLAAAQIKLEAGRVLLDKHSRKSRILLQAHEALAASLQENDVRLIESRFLVGKYYQAQGQKKKSIPYWEKNIETLEAVEGPTHHSELISRAFLVDAYETLGRSEEATEHCLAIGRLTPWEENQEGLPLFRMAPNYPVSAVKRGKEGWARVSFTINEIGVVEAINVIDSSSSVFEKPTIEAISKWRYAPKFENGKPVPMTSHIRLDYQLGKRSVNR